MLRKPAARHFYPRSPCGERLKRKAGPEGPAKISIHALLAESDNKISAVGVTGKNFYPRSPCGERHDATLHCLRVMRISIHALLAESDGGSGVGSWPRAIFLSTLSLRRATPHGQKTKGHHSVFLSTLSLRRATMMPPFIACVSCVFLSTLSLRRATYLAARQSDYVCDFYPRSPCGERHCQHRSHHEWSDFYPRSPCGERQTTQRAG